MKLDRVMIAAPKSGSGKTTITCALLQSLKEQGIPVVSYKCGPDYIDPMFHKEVLGVPSKNLDTFFTGEEETRALLTAGRTEGELALLEGVMGLYDGLGGIREEGSSYHLAKVTGTPIVLVVDAKGMSIVPGFVAMNIHGGGGFDFSECTEEAFHGAVAAHQKHGATTIFPTVLAPEIGVIDKAVAVCEEMMRKKDGPILGLHIEGPYLNPKMAASLFIDKENPADPKEYKEILERTDCIKRWDSSPEIPGALEFAQYLKSRGILSAISHTEAEFDDIKTAYNAGFTHAAHFYNAMPGFHKRREYKYEGTVESVFLMDDMTVEVIADGRHLPSTILRLVYKLKGVERTCLVTDALSCAANEGKPLSDPRIIIEDGVCKLADHSSLVGSIATMDVLVRTMVQKADIPLADAVRMASETPARLMGVSDRTGTLQRGKDADIVILDRKLNVRAVWSMGNLVPETNTLV